MLKIALATLLVLAAAAPASAQFQTPPLMRPFGGGLEGPKLQCAWIGNTWTCW